jgi:hypothetical protein
MLEKWIEGTPESALQKLEALSQVLERMRKVAIQQTYPSDWVIHSSTDRSTGEIIKQVGYLQDSGAERAGKIFGIEVGKVTERREEISEDRTFVYHLEAPAWSKITGEHIDRAVGSRWSGDDFFARGLDEDEKVDPSDVRKSAYANLHGRAVRALAGLSAIPLETLKASGLDTSRCMFVGYAAGAKGGTSAGATVGSAEVKVAFGRSAGKTPAELADKDLDWYVGAYTGNVADPTKAKFIKANQRVLDALTAEKEKRAQGTAHEEATGTKAPERGGQGEGDPAAPRGRKIADTWMRLTEIASEKAGLLLKQVTKDLGQERAKMSDLTDAELDKLAATTDEVLKTVWTHISKPAAEAKK